MARERPSRPLLTAQLAGKALRALRVKRELSQGRLAELANVDRPAVGALERGQRWGLLFMYDRLLVGMGATWTEFGAVLDLFASGAIEASPADLSEDA